MGPLLTTTVTFIGAYAFVVCVGAIIDIYKETFG